MSTLFVGVDGGGSKTAAVVVDRRMKIIGRGLAGPSNYLRVGIEEATINIDKAIASAIATARADPSQVGYTYCGIAGSDHPKHRARMIEALRSLFPLGNFTVDSDARIALIGGVGLHPGIVVIAGTGSVAFGRNESGKEARAGGWGPTIGDEGSGYSIARRGLSAIVRAYDGRGPQTALTDLLCTVHGLCQPEDLPTFVYAPTTRVASIAAYGKMVIDAARAGDRIAKEIVSSEGYELGKTVLAVARKLEMETGPFAVAYFGGAFRAGDLLVGPMREALLAGAPEAEVRPPIETAVEGAARMAIRAARAPRPTRKKK
ncbi:MAG TPA: BadF/BadG/BcrA/BcrD ATPase family protein [Thermoanaerobaculia bacterium]|nr:BadF/BadG/BcrA/BcrD ATPase family protein [Thermoanaerobaculia bacterium]